MDQSVQIRQAKASDWDEIWPIVRDSFRAGNAYAFSPDTSKKDGYENWMKAPRATYVAEVNHKIAGTYYLKPNQSGLGNHVVNAGYIVGSAYRGQGIGRKMCEHSQKEAQRLGFKAMQFNLVVSTNERAIRLWKELGFRIVGTLPNAYRHQKKGLVDALVMYKWLGH